MYDIFISYRRDGGHEMARLIYEHLSFKGLNCFFDLEELGAGEFNIKLLKNIEESRNFVLILSPGALDRCRNENDWVRAEIEHAIENEKNIVPLMMKGFDEDFAVYDTDIEHEPCILPDALYSHDRTQFNYKAAILGLRDYFHKNGYTKACVGLSGGIDSSIVACIAAEALGKENVRGLLMPSPFSPDQSVEDATELAKNLGIEYSVLPITEVYRSMLNTLKPVIGGRDFDLTEENIQARIRTVMLMALQNKTGYILLNSSNKSENALGLCTLYGDTAGAFSVTGDLYKSEMYDLARYINRISNDVIPESIIIKEPSSELRPDQKDSDILPPYEVVDAILIRMIEQGQHREEIINAGFDSEVVEKIHAMIMKNEKKRYQFPPVLRLSACAFGHERLMPLINKYGD